MALRVLLPLLLAGLLTACPELTCKDAEPCPEGRYRDPLCNCSKESEDDVDEDRRSSRYETARCICEQLDGSYDIYFSYRPRQYDRTGLLRVYSRGCKIALLCDTGYLTGRNHMQVSSWRRYDDAAGNTYWIARGHRSNASHPPQDILTQLASAQVGDITPAVVPEAETRFDCRRECAQGAIAENCLSGDVPAGDARSLQRLFALLVEHDSSQPLAMETLLDLFGLPEDPCQRGPSHFKNGILTNRGAPCILRSEVAGEGLRIFVPADLEGGWSSEAGASPEIRIEFANPMLAPDVRLEAADLDGDFGGPVRSLQATGRWLGLETAGGCVAASLPPGDLP